MVNVNLSKQGDAHLLIDNGIVTLIDGGRKLEADAHLIPYLKNLAITKVDNFIISHPHTDHTGGLISLMENGIGISKIYYNLPAETIEDWNYKRNELLELLGRAEELGASVIDLSQGDIVKLSTSKIEVLYSYKLDALNGKRVSVNDLSLILKWQTPHWSALFTGDLGNSLGSSLSADPTLREQLKSDILKTPHHAVENIAPPEFFNAVDAKLHMIPSTKVLWQHPRGKTTKAYIAQSNTAFCHNGLNGTVKLRLTKTSIESNPQRATASCPEGPIIASKATSIVAN